MVGDILITTDLCMTGRSRVLYLNRQFTQITGQLLTVTNEENILTLAQVLVKQLAF